MERCQLFDLMGARIAVAQLPHGTKSTIAPLLPSNRPESGRNFRNSDLRRQLAGPRAG